MADRSGTTVPLFGKGGLGGICQSILQYPAGDVVRAELSCPEGVDDSGRINKWSERILLPDLPLDTHEAWEPGPDDEGYDSVDVPVSPR